MTLQHLWCMLYNVCTTPEGYTKMWDFLSFAAFLLFLYFAFYRD